MEGNSAKVNSIVDKIVESNNSFKLKSSLEQDKEKDSIEKTINTALSVLNEVGKDLVLQDLSVDPDEKFKGFIDSVGNIDISGLTKFTATIVKEKIEEAEKEGLNLRIGQEVLTNTKNLIAESILSLAVVDTMIKNYDNLSYGERKNLWDNFLNFSKEQQKAIVNADRKKLEEIINSSETTDEQKEEASKIKAKYKKADKIEQLLDSDKPEDREKGKRELEKDTQAIERYVIEMQKTDQHFSIDFNNPEHLSGILNSSRMLAGEQSLALQQILAKGKEFTQEFIDEYVDRNEEKSENDSSLVWQEQANGSIQGFDETISKKIQQLPVALSQKFSPKSVQKSLLQYVNTFKNLEEEDISEIATLKDDELRETLQEIFTEDGMDENIASILSSINYNGRFQQILTSPELREQFLQQFDQVIEQGITVGQDVQLEGELEQVFTKYFNNNAVDLFIDAEQELTTEEKPEIPTNQSEFKEDTILDSTKPETITTENLEQFLVEEDTPENTALEVQDNSFIGKVKRVMANMRVLKDADKSKGFFSRLRTSIQTVFGNKTEDYQSVGDDTEQQTSSSPTQAVAEATLQQQRTNDIFQKVEVNPLEAVKQTELNKAKKALENAEQVVEQDDLTQ